MLNEVINDVMERTETSLEILERENQTLKDIINTLKSDNETLKDTIVKLTVERMAHLNE